MRSDDGVDDGGEVVDIREGFDAEDDIIERTVTPDGGLFCASND